jgi:hypothetical protein
MMKDNVAMNVQIRTVLSSPKLTTESCAAAFPCAWAYAR